MKKKTSTLSILSSSTLQSNVILPRIQESYDYLAKIIVIGPSGTGKTWLLKKFLLFDTDQQDKIKQTIGVEFHSKVVELPQNLQFKLQIWDTAGQERFKSITSNYYRGSLGVLLCFDLTRKLTLLLLENDLQDVVNLTNGNIVSCVIVGNKADLAESVEVSHLELVEFIELMKLKYQLDISFIYECSSLTGENVYEVFEMISVKILDKIEKGIIDIRDSSSGVQLGTQQITHSESNMNLEIRGRPYHEKGGCCW